MFGASMHVIHVQHSSHVETEWRSCYTVLQPVDQRGRYPVRPSSGLPKPRVHRKYLGERLRSRQHERSARLLRLNGEGVVETDAMGQSMI